MFLPEITNKQWLLLEVKLCNLLFGTQNKQIGERD